MALKAAEMFTEAAGKIKDKSCYFYRGVFYGGKTETQQQPS